jgi:hypothetical protein
MDYDVRQNSDNEANSVSQLSGRIIEMMCEITFMQQNDII